MVNQNMYTYVFQAKLIGKLKSKFTWLNFTVNCGAIFVQKHVANRRCVFHIVRISDLHTYVLLYHYVLPQHHRCYVCAYVRMYIFPLLFAHGSILLKTGTKYVVLEHIMSTNNWFSTHECTLVIQLLSNLFEFSKFMRINTRALRIA